MKQEKRTFAVFIFSVVLLNSSIEAKATSGKKPDEKNDETLIAETRKVALEFPPRLLAMLQEEIAKGGLASAITVCRDKAPKMAAEFSKNTGWFIRRVSLKNRNPKAVPDPWEKSVLENFDRRATAGENPATLETAEFITGPDGKRMLRYMKALPTQGLCLSCHGPRDQIPVDVKAKLKELYPQDQATGYRVGEIRGALTVKRPL